MLLICGDNFEGAILDIGRIREELCCRVLAASRAIERIDRVLLSEIGSEIHQGRLRQELVKMLDGICL